MFIFSKQVLRNLYSVSILGSLFLSLILTSITANAQSVPNAINLYVPFVTVDGKKVPTRNNGGNSWSYDGDMTDQDLIRYGWDGVAMDLSYKNYPQVGGGWVKVYLNDDTKEENAIIDYGNSPLPIKEIASKLVPGKNKIELVFVDESNNPKLSQSKTFFTFNYKSAVTAPKINVVEPQEGSLFVEGSEKKFTVELENFALESEANPAVEKGILKVFANQITGKPLIVIRKSESIGGNKHLVEFTSKQFDSEVPIGDSKNTKLIFVLAKSSGENLEAQFSRSIVTNYSNSLKDIGLPEISFSEPKSDRIDLGVDGERKFILDLKNFEILSQLTVGPNEDKKGYLQLFVDDTPVKTIWGKNEFTLNEIGYGDSGEGKKVVRAQLVNKDFTKLSPEVYTTVDIIYKPKAGIEQNEDSEANKQLDANALSSNNWRLVILGSIVLIIVLGILILVIKG